MDQDLRVIVMTSNNYLPALEPFAYLLNRYWLPNPQVIVAGFRKPKFDLPENFTFFSIGDQADFPWNRWSDALYITLERFQDEVFCLMLEDYWIARTVNTHAIQLAREYMDAHHNVLKFDLHTDRLYAGGADLNYDTYDYLDIVRSDPQSPYHFSLMPGLWRTENLLKVMIPGESCHAMELDGTSRLSVMTDLDVVGTRQFPLRVAVGLRARDFKNVDVSGLRGEDVEHMRRHGLFRFWGV